VGVFKGDDALGGLADVGDDVERMDRVVAHQLGHRRGAAGLRVEKDAHAASLEEGDAPAVAVHVGEAATGLEAGEREADVGRGVAIHSK